MFDIWPLEPSISESMRPRSDEEEVTSISGHSSSSVAALTAPEDLSPDLLVAKERRGELRDAELFSEFSGRASKGKHSRLLD